MIKSVDLFGRKIKIVLVKEMPPGGENAVGLYYSAEAKILILNSLSEYDRYEVLFHEMFHAAMDRLGFRQSRMSHDVHEMLCEMFARLIMDHFVLKQKKRRTTRK